MSLRPGHVHGANSSKDKSAVDADRVTRTLLLKKPHRMSVNQNASLPCKTGLPSEWFLAELHTHSSAQTTAR